MYGPKCGTCGADMHGIQIRTPGGVDVEFGMCPICDAPPCNAGSCEGRVVLGTRTCGRCGARN